MQSFYFQGNTRFPSQGWLLLKGKCSSRNAPSGTSPHGVTFTRKPRLCSTVLFCTETCVRSNLQSKREARLQELPKLMFYLFTLVNEKCKPNTFSTETNQEISADCPQQRKVQGRCPGQPHSLIYKELLKHCSGNLDLILLDVLGCVLCPLRQIGPAMLSEFTCCSLPVLQHSGRQGKPGRRARRCAPCPCT